MSRSRRNVLRICGAVSGAVLVAGCGGSHQSTPDPTQVGSGQKAAVIQEPYGFRNVAFSCFGGNGVYVTSRSLSSDLPSSVFVVPGDVNCK